MEKNKIDKLYKNKLENFTPEPPADLWPGIEENILRNKRRKKAAFWRYSSIAAALLLAFTSGYFFNAYNMDDKTIPVLRENGNDYEVEYAPLTSDDKGDEVLKENLNKQTGAGERVPLNQKENMPVNKVQHRSISNPQSRPNSEIAETFEFKDENDESTILPESGYSMAVSDAGERRMETRGFVNDIPVFKEKSEADKKSQAIVSSSFLSPAPMDTISGIPAFNGEAKNLQEKKITTSTFDVIALGGPALGFRSVSYNQENSYTQDNVQNEEMQNTYSAGLKMSYKKTGPWEVQLGLFVNNWEQNSFNVELQRSDASAINNSGSAVGFTSTNEVKIETANPGNFIPSSPKSYSLIPDVNHQMRFVDLPFLIGYYIMENKFELKFQAGINTRLLNSNEIKLVYPDGETENVENSHTRNVTVQLIGGPALTYRLKSRLKLHLEPSFLYGVSPVENMPELDTYHHQFIIFSGISYRL